MGTRNLTIVIDRKGEKKVNQYGEWDGYPEVVGIGILEFLRDQPLLYKMEQNLSKVRFLDQDGKDKEFIKSYNDNVPKWSGAPDNRTEEQKHWFENYISRNLSDIVLLNIANFNDEEIILEDAENKEDNTWCEGFYTIDLKNHLFISEFHGKKVEYNITKLPSNEEYLKSFENG